MMPWLDSRDGQLRGLGEVSAKTTGYVSLACGAVLGYLVGWYMNGCKTGRALRGLDGAMEEGRKKALLAKPVRFRGRQMTKAEMIEEMVRLGGQLLLDRFPKYVFNRHTYNRMDHAEQVEYEKKMKIKMPFAVQLADGSYFEITQTEAEYFKSLSGGGD